MTYKDNTPTFNVGNRNLVNFKDFEQNKNAEEQELKSIKRSFKKNEKDQGMKQTKLRYNRVSHKMEDLPIEMIDDKINSIEESCDVDIKSVRDICCHDLAMYCEEVNMVFQWLEDNNYTLCKNIPNNNYPGSTVL